MEGFQSYGKGPLSPPGAPERFCECGATIGDVERCEDCQRDEDDADIIGAIKRNIPKIKSCPGCGKSVTVDLVVDEMPEGFRRYDVMMRHADGLDELRCMLDISAKGGSASFTSNQSHDVCMELLEAMADSMIRKWNRRPHEITEAHVEDARRKALNGIIDFIDKDSVDLDMFPLMTSQQAYDRIKSVAMMMLGHKEPEVSGVLEAMNIGTVAFPQVRK